VSHTLTTEHLVLQPVTAADQDALLAHWTTPQVRRFMFDGAVLTEADIAAAIAESTASFRAGGYGLWLLRRAGGAPLAGTAGLRPLEDLGLEIIWSLAPEAQGRGYATEAARAVLDYALGPLGLPEVLAEIDEGNTGVGAGRRAARPDRVRRGPRPARADDPVPEEPLAARPEACVRNPGLDEDLIVTTDSVTLTDVHTGRLGFAQAARLGRFSVAGPRDLACALPGWAG